MTSVSLSNEKFTTFLRIINLLKDQANDLDIREGIIRQKNNSENCTYEIKLDEFLNLNLPIIKIKEKLNLFNTFKNNKESDIIIESNSEDERSNFTISDQYSKLLFAMTDLQYMDNKFITEEELNNSWEINNSELILTVNIPKTITDRIKVVTDVFNTTTAHIIFTNNTAMIKAQTINTEQEAIFLKDIPIATDIECMLIIPRIPFIMDHDGELSLSIYKFVKPNGQEIAYNVFSSMIEDIPIKILSGSLIRSSN